MKISCVDQNLFNRQKFQCDSGNVRKISQSENKLYSIICPKDKFVCNNKKIMAVFKVNIMIWLPEKYNIQTLAMSDISLKP